MLYINTQIGGDWVFGAHDSEKRLCLHAHILEITIPASDRRVFTAPIPELFEDMV
jgi:23S rRNA-/tRNA-specific pseudouridylate synthase